MNIYMYVGMYVYICAYIYVCTYMYICIRLKQFQLRFVFKYLFGTGI